MTYFDIKVNENLTLQEEAWAKKLSEKKRKKERAMTLFEVQIFRQWIDTVWMEILSPSEYMVLNFVATRTLGWGKFWEIITLGHFERGVYRRDGTGRFCCGTGLTRATIIKTRDRLVHEGFLMQRPHRGTFKYGVNLRAMTKSDDPCRPRLKGTSKNCT